MSGQSEDFSVKKMSGPLSDKEIGICLSALGLNYDRFSIVIPVEKLGKEEKQPIYFFAAKASGIEGYSYNSAAFDVDNFAKKYEFAMVIYASIKK